MRHSAHTSRALLLTLALAVTACGGASGTADNSAAASAPTLPAGAERVRIMAYNVKHGEGNDGHVDLARAAAVIRRERPDVVTLQEIDRGTRRTDRVDQATRLAQLTGMAPAFGAFMDYDGGEYGMAILSRWPIVDVVNERLPDGAEPRTALRVRVRSPETGQEVVVVGIHFYRDEGERLAQMRRLTEALEGEAAPVILAGDFNSEPGTGVMRQVDDAGWQILDKGPDRLTFPSDEPRTEIDYIALRPVDRFVVLGHRVLDEPEASDHRPLIADVALRRR